MPRTRLAEVLDRIAEMGAEAGLRVANVFHAGDGNLHPLVLYDDAGAGETERAEQLSGGDRRAVRRAGGSLSGEHGIGTDKACSMPKMFTDDDLAVMERVRAAFDPHGLCNPGKVFPTPRLCGERPGPYRPHPLEEAGVIERSDEAAAAGDRRPTRSAAAAPRRRPRPTRGRRAARATRPGPRRDRAAAGTAARAGPGALGPVDAVLDQRADRRRRAQPGRHDRGGPRRHPAARAAGRARRARAARGARRGAGRPTARPSAACSPPPTPGPPALVHGSLRDLVIGATVVLADGTVARTGGHVIKNVAGYDLAKLLHGSYGTLGVVAEVVLRLHPLPEAARTRRGAVRRWPRPPRRARGARRPGRAAALQWSPDRRRRRCSLRVEGTAGGRRGAAPTGSREALGAGTGAPALADGGDAAWAATTPR